MVKLSFVADMEIRTLEAPSTVVSSKGLWIASSAAFSALASPEATPMPMWPTPLSIMVVLMSAKSTLIIPGVSTISVIPLTPFFRMVLAVSKACVSVVPFSDISNILSLGMTISVSTYFFNCSIPCSAFFTFVFPSRVKGLVTTATVKMPRPFEILATIGAAPVPVPPPMPAVINTISDPSIRAVISASLSSADLAPMAGSAPAPLPLVVFSPN